MTELELRARDLLRRFPLIDGHNDLPWALRVRADPELSQAYGLAADGQIPNLDDPADIDLAVPAKGLHTDLPRLEAGGVGAQFWSVYVPGRLPGGEAVTTVLEQIDLARRVIANNPGALELAQTADSVVESMPEDARPLVRNLFLRLTKLGDGIEASRRCVNIDELVPEDTSATDFHILLDRLAEARLVTLGDGTAGYASSPAP